ncbi:MAG: hypothetical protein M3Y08_11720, partial [Fibrobacterota bacterium]|nr:hypothetical protein [Fibrobacterota bacterium]
ACLAGSLALTLASLTISCISDGPNKTGGEYLAENGILLQSPLHHVTLKGFPVDSFWTTDEEISHLGDSLLLAGITGDFTAEPRMAFQIVDTSMLDSLEADSAVLRLSLATPRPAHGLEELRGDTATDGSARDSIGFVVSAWVKSDAGLDTKPWADTVSARNNRFLVRDDTIASLPTPSTTDTIFLKVSTAYAGAGIQTRALPALETELLKSKSNKHIIHLRLTPIPGDTSDVGPAMLRLGGQYETSGGVNLEPLLLFGKSEVTTNWVAKNRLQTLVIGNRRQVNYSLQYSGPRNDMLTTKLRGLHVILDRKALIDSIDADLERQGKTPHPHPSGGDFELSYFVPYASMTLPVEPPSLEGGFPVEMRLVSSVDSLLGDTLNGGIREEAVPMGSKQVLWFTYEPGFPDTPKDEVSIGYEKVEDAAKPELRRVVLSFSKTKSSDDTLYIRTGETREWTVGYNSNGFMVMNLTADSTTLTVRSYLSTRARTENNAFRDPETGKTLTSIEARLPRFLRPSDTLVSLRATNGLQNLLNRTRLGQNALQDFKFQPVIAVDSTVQVNTINVPAPVPYPVLSVITPRVNGKDLRVDLDIYLYPLTLKAR